MQKSLIIGMGEVGKSLWNILSKHYYVDGIDSSEDKAQDQYDIIHICFGYTDKFIEYVKEYQLRFKPKYTIVHSSVPVGTCAKLDAIHSPIRGLHPNLESGILTFPKFLGGPDASQVADYFRRADIKVILYDKSDTTEALKLFDTEYYRHCIEFAHRVKEYCDKHKLNYAEVYTIPNETYNDGYTKLNHPEYVRPVLQPIMKEIGGHCLLPNAKLIQK